MEVTDPPAVTLIENPETVLALSAVRRRVLAALDTPASASGVADRLGLTRQKVNYHMRALEDAGLGELREMVAHGGLRAAGRLGEIARAGLAVLGGGDQTEQSQAHRIGEGLEHAGELLRVGLRKG